MGTSLGRLWFGFSIVFAVAAQARPLSGTFTSPLGPLQITEAADGSVGGSVTSPKNVCGFARGTVVLTATRLGDSLTGTFKACRLPAEGCSAEAVNADTLLLVTHGGTALLGALHWPPAPAACKAAWTGDALGLRKAGVAATATTKPTRGARDQAESLAREAGVFIEQGKAEEARVKCLESIKVDPTFSQGHTCLGVTFILRDRFDEAFAAYRAALEVDPSNRDVYYNIASIYAIQGNTAEALKYLKIAVLNGYLDLKTFAEDPHLKTLRGLPEFEKLKSGIVE